MDSARWPAEITTYVGRESEILAATRLLGMSSVVTLTGPGGVGKTRLALRVAAELRATFADGAVFVPLAELHEPKLLVSTLAERLGLSDQSARPATDVLVKALRQSRLLLVLDNCEHLVGECAQLIDTLVRACPGLVVLVTSRQSLGLAGERILPVPPLAIPEPSEPPDRLPRFDAVRLFVDRATAVVPSFAISEDNAADVVLLCSQLDGLPLAIELAAVRLRALSVRQVAERLGERFTLLSGSGKRTGPSRHETLRALIDWSHELCTEQQRLLWARLSVFAGSFDLDSAEAVCSAEGLDRGIVLDLVDGLIDKSILLRAEQSGVVRYRMLETVRQYGEDRLRLADDLLRMKRRHRDWYLELTLRCEAEWLGPRQAEWIDRLRGEHANLRAALDFCASDPAEASAGLRMVPAVKEYWLVRGFTTEGRIHLTKLLASAPEDAPSRARALWCNAFLELIQGDMPAYQRTLPTAAELAEATADDSARAFVLHVRGYAALVGADMQTAAELFGTAADMFHAQHDLSAELWSRFNYGISIALAGELDRGRQVLRECIDALIARGEVYFRSWALWSLAAAEYLAGDLSRAREAGFEVLRLQQSIGDQVIIGFALTVTAGCANHGGEDRR
ncbi:MAG: ATP-binding protein, partial [Thermocrispum sp.]